jgi:hypothetical protein
MGSYKLMGLPNANLANQEVEDSEFIDEVNVSLSNSLSHGLYWFRKDTTGNNILCYVDELGMSSTHKIPQVKEVVKKSSLLLVCLSEIASTKAGQGFFK